MLEVFVEKIADFAEGDRRIVFHDGSEIGVFHWQGEFYAYENLCLHPGGPCCEGVIMHKVEDVLGPDKIWLGQKFSADEAHFVCPWHGYEYDIKTGACRSRNSTPPSCSRMPPGRRRSAAMTAFRSSTSTRTTTRTSRCRRSSTISTIPCSSSSRSQARGQTPRTRASSIPWWATRTW